MGYAQIDPADLAATDDFSCDRRSIDEAVGLDALALTVYTIAPGESLARSYHRHATREEAFYVLDGALTVETAEGERTVPAGEVFVAEADSPHRPYNPASASDPVRVLAAGAPRSDPGLPADRPE
ncbi:cupin domain-containing protein [Halococcoides cellulosivorans]|uniref:Cupin domain-containing protein n=1 Tax=Halococcoides cellulosivorans TaxID=1679096 RepID=A0A2R4X2R0_9EURY|nr:cupin domain-containing protein [Halococcoides cellulosivorans]AWB27993.1 cupin domain-containing protein [Halococcoides cellulosivorans]